jgi:hypothetical protein
VQEGPHSAADLDFNHPDTTEPISGPGEQVLFSSNYRGAKPLDFETVYRAAGGHFDAAGTGPTEKKFPGRGAKNLPFFIDASWDGKTPPDGPNGDQKTFGRNGCRFKGLDLP